MGSTVKYLESLGQNASIKQFDSLDQMLDKMKSNENVKTFANDSANELVCGLVTHNDQVCGMFTHDQVCGMFTHNDQVCGLFTHNDQAPILFAGK